MLWVQEAEEQRNGNRLRFRRSDGSDEARDFALGEWGDGLAVGADALGDLEAALTGNEGGRGVLEEIVEVGARGAA